ncbi:MAG: serine protein kinase RIO [Thermoplasmata archaeon]|nr:serine protein kinase RIO [Thermoplasmata archaeon]
MEDSWFDALERQVERILEREGGDELRKTESEVFDRKTLSILQKMISSGVFSTLDFPISTGKEGNVFRATTPAGGLLAVKIYRTSTATFKSIEEYIRGDPRFKHVRGHRRNLIDVWCSKEYRNLRKMYDAGVHVPEPVKAVGNVLVMSYIGGEETPAPLLKDLSRMHRGEDMLSGVLGDRLTDDPDIWEVFYSVTVEDMGLIYQEAGLVHSDLSEYNILVWNGLPWVIDVAQAVTLDHPMAEEWLVRDCRNIAVFFRKMGVDTTPEAVLETVKEGG